MHDEVTPPPLHHAAQRVPPLDAPPVLQPPPVLPPPSRSHSGRKLLVQLLSLCLGLFLTDAIISLLDDSLILFLDLHAFSGIRAVVSLGMLLLGIAVYGLLGFLPMIPKRLLLPVLVFSPLAIVLSLPLSLSFFDRTALIGWMLSLGQCAIAAAVLFAAQRRWSFHWPLVPAERLTARKFSGRHLLGFIAANLFGVLPAVAIYLAVCTALAINHATDGFVQLRPRGLVLQTREYVNADGRTIHLVPMAHIGDAGFYRSLTQSFPTNATILTEGVSDEHNLLTNKISYQRAAAQLGLAEQQNEFHLPEANTVPADVDVSEFRTNTIHFLNLVMAVHARGLDAASLRPLLQYQPPPNFETELFDDLLGKRNRHLLAVIEKELRNSQVLIVPWGAAHMPEVARELQKSGFRLKATEDRVAIRFGSQASRPQTSATNLAEPKPARTGTPP